MTDGQEFRAKLLRSDVACGASLPAACLAMIAEDMAGHTKGDLDALHTIDAILDTLTAYTEVDAERRKAEGVR